LRDARYGFESPALLQHTYSLLLNKERRRPEDIIAQRVMKQLQDELTTAQQGILQKADPAAFHSGQV
jgi:hypothetical protein